MMTEKFGGSAPSISDWNTNNLQRDNLDDLLQQVRTNVSGTSYPPGEMAIQPGWSNMESNWELNNQQACTLPQWSGYDCSPPLSHINSPIDHPPVSDSLPAYSASFNTNTSLQVPFDFKTNTVTFPQCTAMSPQQCITSQTLSITPQQLLAIEQLKFSSMSDTPIPSSSDEDSNASPSLPVEKQFTELSEELKNVESKEEVLKLIPKDVRVPQRKGNMQLWQFLYAILEDQFEIIEWTANKSEYEFRLLQPDVIAIWWGHQKNRQNMNYDKLSRSLRYYYNRKIITKVNSERYVYRFCCNPELLYSALGNSHTKPKLKEMPTEAKQILEWNHNMSNRAASQTAPLLKSPSPSKLTSVDYIHSQENNVGALEQITTTSSSMSTPQNFYYTGGFQNSSHCYPLDTSYLPMPPPPPPPQPHYPMYYNCLPSMTVGAEWDPFPHSM
ncbi:uncharacterized protein [Dysidea avara]|uniref:uncharacterized protein n=1 Tax=Dysidea avara TaxID=196820 RepID=UPI003318598E